MPAWQTSILSAGSAKSATLSTGSSTLNGPPLSPARRCISMEVKPLDTDPWSREIGQLDNPGGRPHLRKGELAVTPSYDSRTGKRRSRHSKGGDMQHGEDDSQSA